MSSVVAFCSISYRLILLLCSNSFHNPVFRPLITRIVYTLPVLWLVVSAVFLLIHLVPGDPIVQMLG